MLDNWSNRIRIIFDVLGDRSNRIEIYGTHIVR